MAAHAGLAALLLFGARKVETAPAGRDPIEVSYVGEGVGGPREAPATVALRRPSARLKVAGSTARRRLPLAEVEVEPVAPPEPSAVPASHPDAPSGERGPAAPPGRGEPAVPAGAAEEGEEAPQPLRPGWRGPEERERGCTARSVRLPRELRGLLATLVVRFGVKPSGRPYAFSFADDLPPELRPRVEAAVRQAILSCEWVPGIDAEGRPTSIALQLPLRFQPR